MIETARVDCRPTWLASSMKALLPWSSPSDRRQPRSPDRSMSRAPRPPDDWAAERSSFWETLATRPASLPEGVAAFDYAPFAALLPRASVLVFPGGIGTTGLAMRPRLARAGGSPRPRSAGQCRPSDPAGHRPYASTGAATRHSEPQRNWSGCWRIPSTRDEPSNLSGQVRQEDGVAAACDALEAIFASDARGDRGPR